MRIFLFLITNIAVMSILFISTSILGVQEYVGGQQNYYYLLMFSAIFGFSGSFISLLLSKWMAKKSMRLTMVDVNNPRNDFEKWYINVVKKQSTKVGIKMPEIAHYHGAPNAFATGAFKNKALIAVSDGLVERMSNDVDSLEAVIGHEISHIANGDMQTLTLLQGVVNTFVFFFARVIGNIIDRVILKNEKGRGFGYYIVVFVLEILLGILASIIVMWFSRYREFKADKGGAELTSNKAMARALNIISGIGKPLPEKMSSFGIFGVSKSSFRKLFSTHPPIEERIKQLLKN